MALLQQTWANAKLDSFTKPALLRAWQTNWPTETDLVKIIYDRNAAEVRVLGRWSGKSFATSFPVETDLAAALTQARAFIQAQSQR